MSLTLLLFPPLSFPLHSTTPFLNPNMSRDEEYDYLFKGKVTLA